MEANGISFHPTKLPFADINIVLFPVFGFTGNLSLLDIFSHFSRGRESKWKKRLDLVLGAWRNPVVRVTLA